MFDFLLDKKTPYLLSIDWRRIQNGERVDLSLRAFFEKILDGQNEDRVRIQYIAIELE